MKPASVVRDGIIAGTVTLAAALGLYASPAFAAAQVQHLNASIPAGTPFDLGPSPVGLPASCPFPNDDANFVFASGSVVMHESSNANGDWGGETLQGPAAMYEGSTPIGQGHLTVWFGGGNNSPTRGQNEGGFTANYTGTDSTGPDSTGTVQIHVNGQMTIPANSSTGAPTAEVLNVNVTCA